MKGLSDLRPVAAAPALTRLSVVNMPQLTAESFEPFRKHPRLAMLSAHTGKVTYFEGTPIPSSLLLVGLVAVCAWLGRLGDALPLGTIKPGAGTLHPLALLWALSGSLMISKTLRIPKP